VTKEPEYYQIVTLVLSDGKKVSMIVKACLEKGDRIQSIRVTNRKPLPEGYHFGDLEGFSIRDEWM
jgi:hypothetical protein